MQIKIRDLRKKSQFILDNSFFDNYARFLGAHTVAVYNCFCRHANKEQKCWPSIKKMSEELGISRSVIISAIKKLEFWNIIVKKRTGKTANNRYWLVHRDEWNAINDKNLKKFSDAFKRDFTRLKEMLHQSIGETSNKGVKSKELNRKESASKKRYFRGMEMRFAQNKWWCIPDDGGSWLEFAGQESEIEWK